MDHKIKNIEEKITLIQSDVSNMSEEIYNQQKEILELKLQIKKLKFELQDSHHSNQSPSDQFLPYRIKEELFPYGISGPAKKNSFSNFS